MIVVLDTNIWVSGLHFAKRFGVPTQALERAIQTDTIAICPEMESEILRVLTQKFSWKQSRAEYILSAALNRALRVTIDGTVKRCRDPKDDMFLECAQRAKAHLLVAGDKDLLVLKAFEGTRIVTPAAYLHEF